jgi:hypothetical protein
MATDNTYSSMRPNLKEEYSSAKQNRFNRLRKMMGAKPSRISKSDVSMTPQGAVKLLKNFSIKGAKGVAV